MRERFGPAGLAMRMAFRPRVKLFATGLLTILLSFLLTGAVLLHSGMKEAATRGANRLGADLMVAPKGAEILPQAGMFGAIPVHLSLPEGLERSIAAMPGIMRVAPQYVIASAKGSCCEAGNLLLVGFDPARDITVLPWLRPDARIDGGRESILIGGAVMKARGAAMHFYNHAFTVAARLEKSGSAYFDNAVFVPLDGVKAMELSSGSGAGASLSVPWGRPSILLVQLAPSMTPHDAALSLERHYPAVRVLAIPGAVREQRLKMTKLALGVFWLAAAAWFFVVPAGGALQLLYWRERRQTLALLYAFGCGKGRILLCAAGETLALSLAGMVAGSMGALVALRHIAPFLTAITGMPLLADGMSRAASNIPWLWAAFGGAMAAEAAIVVFLLLRHEPADLLRGI